MSLNAKTKPAWLAGVAALGVLGAVGGTFAIGFASAQDAPESLLPPGFDDPAPAPTPSPAPPPPPVAPPVTTPSTPQSTPQTAPGGTVQPLPPGATLPPAPNVSSEELSGLPTLEELEELSTDQLDDLLGLKPQFDIPPAARRSLSQVGVLSPEEGGLPTRSLVKQPETLVRAVLGGTRGPLVSRWGHIMLRRTLASRLTAPEGMSPVDFAALRAGVLNSMGEFGTARALVQDIDTGNWSKALTSEALTAYIASSDFVGACPAVRLQGGEREDPTWVMMQAICNAYAGEGALAGSQLNGAQNDEIAPEIDILLAQRYAGAAGRGRGGTTVSWDGVEELTPWRFALANAVGEDVPDGIVNAAFSEPRGDYYPLSGASAAMLPLDQRALYAGVAADRGVLSSAALVDIYSQVYANEGIGGDVALRSRRLRDAYVGANPGIRIDAMRSIWGGETMSFPGLVLTAYAAARIPPSAENAGAAGDLIASMLTAGLDRDAVTWAPFVESGSQGWALIALADPDGVNVDLDALQSFWSDDQSEEALKTQFLVAGLAGLGRLPLATASDYDVNLSRQTRWTRMIDRAAQVDNPTMVALLAGLGMQGRDWSQMTPLHLYHITRALSAVGMDAEARMIAAEAVSRS